MGEGLIKFPSLLRRRAAYARHLAEISENGTISAFLKDLAQRLDKQALSDEVLAPPHARVRRIQPVDIGTSDRADAAAPLSRMTIDMLLDLVEIKISYMDVADLEDRRDLHILERCRRELRKCSENGVASAAITPLRRGRRPLNP